MTTFYGRADAPKAWRADGQARLAFACVETRCALKTMWTGEPLAYQIRTPRLEAGAMVHMSEIRLSGNKAD